MDQMPEYKDGFITLWRNGSWLQIPVEEMQKVIEESANGTQEGSNVPAGE